MKKLIVLTVLLTACAQAEHTEPIDMQESSIYNEARVTKKPFGLYVSPSNSPVSPERFTGYHLGTDFELFEGENPHDMEVKALCKGKLLVKRMSEGYGGVAVQSCVYKEKPITVLYGHLKIDSISAKPGDMLSKGEFIGVLGEGGTDETDGERSHLHLSVRMGDRADLRGYFEEESGLTKWYDPMEVLDQL